MANPTNTSRPAAAHSQGPTSGPTSPPMGVVVIAWLWVGLPLAWGVFETFKKTLELFR